MPARLRVGIVGLGYGQRVLLPAFQADARCAVTGVCGARPERAREAAGRLGLRAYDAWEAMVGDPGIDAVAIATPPAWHAPIALAAFGRGKHVFCEKPLAASEDEARRMTEAARSAGTAHMVGFELPETAVWQRAREVLRSGALGALRYITVTWHVQTYANRMRQASWKTRPSQGGGTMNEFVSHCLHYLEWLAGPIGRLSSAPLGDDDRSADRDAVALLSLKLLDGATVSVSVCTDAAFGEGHAIRVYGDAGTLALVNPTADHATGFSLYLGLGERATLERQIVPDAPAPASGDGRIEAVGRLIDRFVMWAQTGQASRPCFEDGLRVQAWLDAAWRSRREGVWHGLR